MLKLGLTKTDNTPLVVLGLSHANLDKLREGLPVMIDMAEIVPGLTGTIFLYAGTDEPSMTDELAKWGMISPQQAEDGKREFFAHVAEQNAAAAAVSQSDAEHVSFAQQRDAVREAEGLTEQGVVDALARGETPQSVRMGAAPPSEEEIKASLASHYPASASESEGGLA